MKLKVTKRELLGKKAKSLRKDSLVPASVFGPSDEPMNIQLNEKEFRKVFKETGYNHFIDLEIDGDKSFKVVVKDIQVHPVKDHIQSIGFYRIDQKRKIYVEIPIIFTGTSIVETNKLGFLVRQMENLRVHCLPKDVPEKIEVDVSKLEKPGDAFTVSDITLPTDVELDSSIEATNAVVYAASMQKAEEVEVAPVEGAAEGEAAAAPAEGGEAPKAEEKK